MTTTSSCNPLLLSIYTASIFRPHRTHAVHRCGPLLQIDVACSVWSVCVLVTRVSCAKRLNRSSCLWGLTHVGPRNHVLDKGQLCSCEAGRQDGMRPFATLLWTIVSAYKMLRHVSTIAPVLIT